MQKLKHLSLFLLLLISAACDSDDAPETEAVTVTTTDLNFNVAEGTAANTVIGALVGASSSGAVTFSIASQTPSGAVAIGGDNNTSLVVANASLIDFDQNPQITIVVDVSSGDVTEQSTVTITVTQTAVAIEADDFVGDLNIQLGANDVLDTALGTRFVGALDDNGLLTITGDDPFDFSDENDEIQFQLVPSGSDPSVGTINFEFSHGSGDDEGTFTGSGTYDNNTGIIRIVYSYVLLDGFSEENLVMEINIAANGAPEPDDEEEVVDCSSASVDLSVFNTDGLFVASGIEIDGIIDETNLGSDFNGVVDACSVTISGSDILGVCPETTTNAITLSFPNEPAGFTGDSFFANEVEIADYGCGITNVLISAELIEGDSNLFLSWEYEDMEGEFVFGSTTISTEEINIGDGDGGTGEVVCPDSIDLSVFDSDNLAIASGLSDGDGNPQETDLGRTFSGLVDACTLTLSGDDLFGLCNESVGQSIDLSFEFERRDDNDNVVPGEFETSFFFIDDYGCGITDLGVSATFTSGNTITVIWDYLDDSDNLVDGTATITAP